MAVANVLRISILGTMPGGEVWSVNPVFQLGGVSTSEDITADQCVTMATAIDAVTIPSGLLSANATSVFFTGTRVEARRWDGTLAAQGEHEKTGVAGTGGTNQHPFQTAIVSSLRTGGFGASSRGRLYWPATALSLTGSTLRPSSSSVSSILGAVKTYLTSIGAAIDVSTTNSPVLSVWSRTNASTQPVTSIQMGDVLDVQRRRRDQTVENYTSVTFP